MAEYPLVTTPIIQLTEELSNPYLRGIVKANYIGTLIKTGKFDKIEDVLNSIFEELDKIEQDDLKVDVLVELTESIISTKYNKARDILDKILEYTKTTLKKKRYQAEIIVHVVCAFANNDMPEHAKKLLSELLDIIHNIKSEKERVILLCKWPTVFERGAVKLSDETINQIISLVSDFSEEMKPRALRCVSEILIRLMQFPQAEKFAEQIENREERDALLRELAKKLLENKNYGHAVEVLKKIEIEREKAAVLKYWARLISQ